MKILIVTQYYWPEDFRINELASGLAARGHQVQVLTGLPNYPSGSFSPGYGLRGPWTQEHDGVRIVRAPLLPRGAGSKLGLILNYLSFAISGSVIAALRCRARYDAIFVYEVSPVTVGLPAIVARAFSGAPLYFWVLDLWPESLSASGMIRSPLADRVAAAVARFVYRFCDVILAPSRAYAEPIRRTARAEREVIYFPQWSSGEAAAPPSVEIPPLPEGFKVMFTGNVGASQDFETILAAAEALREREDIRWIIVGDGHKLSWVREEIVRRGLCTTVSCLGRFPSSSMPMFFERADVLLATLKKDPAFSLTVPAKIQSYLAAGRPLVTAIDGEVSHLVEESGAGIAASAGDPTALAKAVKQLAATPLSERQRMGAAGRAFFEAQFERESVIDGLVKLLQAGPGAVPPKGGIDAAGGS